MDSEVLLCDNLHLQSSCCSRDTVRGMAYGEGQGHDKREKESSKLAVEENLSIINRLVTTLTSQGFSHVVLQKS